MVLSNGDTDLGTFTAVKHHIDTGNSKPIKQRMRRTPLGYANEEQDHLEKLLKAGVIEPSCSEWASPNVLVRKRDGSVGWCSCERLLPPTFTSRLNICTGGMQVFHYPGYCLGLLSIRACRGG